MHDRKLILIFALAFLLLPGAALAQYWVSDPATCPQTDATVFPGVNCSPDRICGSNTGTPQCYNTSTIAAPASTVISNTQHASSLGGGYVLDCYATADAAAPHCDNSGNLWCNRDSTCNSDKRDTSCTANTFGTFTCGSCWSGLQDCTGSTLCEVTTGTTNFPTGLNNVYQAACTGVCKSGYTDCDASGQDAGNGCEVQTNVSPWPTGSNNTYDGACSATCYGGYTDCNASGVGAGDGCEVQTGVTNYPTGANNTYDAVCAPVCDTGFLDCDATGAGVGNGCEVQDGAACTIAGVSGTISGCGGCIIPKSYFETGTQAGYSTTDPLLWGTQGGSGDLAKLQNYNNPNEVFVVDNQGDVGIGTTAPDAAAALDIVSSSKGALLPRMTTTQRDAIVAPPAGLIIYNTTTNEFNFYDGAAWGSLGGGGLAGGSASGTAGNLFTLDADGTALATDTLTLKFGSVLNKMLSWNGLSGLFEFNDSLKVTGNLTVTGKVNNVDIGAYVHIVTLSPRYPDSVFEADGTNNSGSMHETIQTFSGAEKNLLHWKSKQTTLQDYDTVVRYTLPAGFVSLSTPAISFTYKTTGTTADSKIDFTVEKASALGTDQINATGIGLSSTTWTTGTFSLIGATTWVAGDTLVLRIKTYSKNLSQASMSDIGITLTAPVIQ